MDGSCSEIWSIYFLDCRHDRDEEGWGINTSSGQELHWNSNNIIALSPSSFLLNPVLCIRRLTWKSVSFQLTAYRYRIHLVQLLQEGYSRPVFTAFAFNSNSKRVPPSNPDGFKPSQCMSYVKLSFFGLLNWPNRCGHD